MEDDSTTAQAETLFTGQPGSIRSRRVSGSGYAGSLRRYSKRN